jgi:hypothetical protein
LRRHITHGRGIVAFTQAGRYNVYTLVSDVDVQSRLGVARRIRICGNYGG